MESKYSRQREAIYDYLSGTKAHPTAETIYQNLKVAFPDLSLATVYRNLTRFLSDGRIIRLDSPDRMAHYDATVTTHYHFCCEACGGVYDLEMAVLRELPEAVSKVGEAHSHQLLVSGICYNCKN